MHSCADNVGSSNEGFLANQDEKENQQRRANKTGTILCHACDYIPGTCDKMPGLFTMHVRLQVANTLALKMAAAVECSNHLQVLSLCYVFYSLIVPLLSFCVLC